jgi:hypothetical protein
MGSVRHSVSSDAFSERPPAAVGPDSVVAKGANALSGANATVVGILLATFYQPIWTSAFVAIPAFLLAPGFQPNFFDRAA